MTRMGSLFPGFTNAHTPPLAMAGLLFSTSVSERYRRQPFSAFASAAMVRDTPGKMQPWAVLHQASSLIRYLQAFRHPSLVHSVTQAAAAGSCAGIHLDQHVLSGRASAVQRNYCNRHTSAGPVRLPGDRKSWSTLRLHCGEGPKLIRAEAGTGCR